LIQLTDWNWLWDATQIRLVTSAGLIDAKVVQVDAANDLALLKAEGKFFSLPISTSRSAQLGSTVATIGFPDIGLQGFVCLAYFVVYLKSSRIEHLNPAQPG
jgi:hypothetical protein